MSVPPYIQGFPQDGSNLGNTRVQIRKNLDGTFLTLGEDHINNNGVSSTNPSITGTPGYHNVIRFQDQGNRPTTPAAKTNVTQMYTNTDIAHSVQQIILESKTGKVYQLTTLLDSFNSTFGDDLSTNAAGWTFLPGGLIQNYGYTVRSTLSQVVDFTSLSLPTFANKNYIILVTPYANDNLSTSCSFLIFNTGTDLTESKFTIRNISGFQIGFYWTATGKPA